MAGNLEQVLQSIGKPYADKRLHIFEVQAEAEDSRMMLRGRVLDESTRLALLDGLRAAFPQLAIDASALRVLRKPGNRVLAVATNLTSLKGAAAWLSEETSQLLAGQRLELLEENERWGFVRQSDGYLGWAYLPYLTSAEPLPASHLVIAPDALLWDAPHGEQRCGRVLCGTEVALLDRAADWGRIAVFAGQDPQIPAQIGSGWLPLSAIRALDGLPHDEKSRRRQMMADAATLLGAPYLWGGCSLGGIDCSGFAQLIHRLVGVTLPRDADQQFDIARPVEPPFQPGDLLFFGDRDEPSAPWKITHVTASTGGWNIIHSSRSHNGVYFDNVQEVPHLRDSFAGARTFLG